MKKLINVKPAKNISTKNVEMKKSKQIEEKPSKKAVTKEVKERKKSAPRSSITRKTLMKNIYSERDVQTVVAKLMKEDKIVKFPGVSDMEKKELLDKLPNYIIPIIHDEIVVIEEARQAARDSLTEAQKQQMEQLANYNLESLRYGLGVGDIELVNKNQMKKEELIFQIVYQRKGEKTLKVLKALQDGTFVPPPPKQKKQQQPEPQQTTTKKTVIQTDVAQVQRPKEAKIQQKPAISPQAMKAAMRALGKA